MTSTSFYGKRDVIADIHGIVEMAARSRSRRKRRPEEPGPSCPPTKSSGPAHQWEWQGDGEVWQEYAPDLSRSLTEALVANHPTVNLQVGVGTTMRVSFQSMLQCNTTTGWQRSVRCVSTARGYEFSDVWQWQDPTKTSWQPIDVGTGRLLEACSVLAHAPVAITLGGIPCEADVISMQLKQSGTAPPPAPPTVHVPIRRLTPDNLPKWEWQNEYSVWVVYPTALVDCFEAARDAGDSSCPFQVAGRRYKLHLDRMEQENCSTGVLRKVQRSAPPLPAPPLPTPPDPGPSTTTEPSVAMTTTSEPHPTSNPVSQSSAGPSSSGVSDVIAMATGTSSSDVVSVDTPVDLHCKQKFGKARVFCEASDVWNAMLNQTNLRNNNNKFYIIQLLEDNVGKQFSVWMRWGRVGLAGQSKLESYGGDIEAAKRAFCKKFADKTFNDWEDRAAFVKHEGKYDMLAMDYSTKVEEEVEEVDAPPTASAPSPPLESKLDKRVQDLIQLICNIQAMEDTVVEMKFDTQKAPLGKLTVEQIMAGYKALKRIEDCIQAGQLGDQLVKACDEFYTRIPHSFGMQRPPILRTVADVKQKLDLLQALGDIEVAMKVLSSKGDSSEHVIDRHYHSLHCPMEPLDPDHAHFKMVETYLLRTHGHTHSQYTLSVLDVFVVDKKDEEQKFKDIGNRMLLWHGSRLTNWVGILSQGLRIAPPEAPVTGYMFGKGVYFADMCSKSANYCFATKAKSDGILLLCDVALGTTNDLLAANYQANKLPKGKHSTRGLGRTHPDPAHQHTTSDGCVVPLGTGIDSGVKNPKGYTLQYNEYVVYDTAQVKMKYVVRVKFNFK